MRIRGTVLLNHADQGDGSLDPYESECGSIEPSPRSVRFIGAVNDITGKGEKDDYI